MRCRPSTDTVSLHVEDYRRAGGDLVDSRIEKTGDSPAMIMWNAPELGGSKGRC